jgi:hypothetical protein
MKKILFLMTSAVIGVSLSAQQIDLRGAPNRTKSPATKQMTWTHITLPYSQMVTYDTATCELVPKPYPCYTKGFSFTLTDSSSVVISGPHAEAYYQLFTSKTADSSIASGLAIYQSLAAGTYYILADDYGTLFFRVYDDEPLTTRMDVYVANGPYKSYTELSYQSLDTTQTISGHLRDTLLLFPTTIQIIHSTYNPYYMNVQEGSSYEFTYTFNPSDSTEEFSGGLYILNNSLTGRTSDILRSAFVRTGTPTSSAVYTASHTGTVKILPFSYANGIPYELSVKRLETHTVPDALDAAIAITDFPYEQTGIMKDGLAVDCQDASFIGNPDYPNDLFYCYPFKVNMAENASLTITMNVDYLSTYNVGQVYLFEKSNNAYTKIGQAGFDEDDQIPTIMYTAPEEMDLYILASNTIQLPFSLSSIAGDMPYELHISHSTPSALEKSNAMANIKISNPVKDFVTIQESTGKNIEVYDNLGKCILKQKITSDNEQIATNSWSKGIYFVKLTDNGTNLGIAKLVKI